MQELNNFKNILIFNVRKILYKKTSGNFWNIKKDCFSQENLRFNDFLFETNNLKENSKTHLTTTTKSNWDINTLNRIYVCTC